MKKYLFVMLFLLAFLPAKIKPTRFVSDWLWISGNSVLSVEHHLETRPLEVEVWIAFYLDKSDRFNFDETYPIYESEFLYVQVVNPTFITVVNTDEAGYFVQVVGVP